MEQQGLTGPTTRRSSCRLCGSTSLIELFSLGSQYVSNFVERNKIRSGPQVPIELILCEKCSLVQQRYTAPQDFLYSRHYWYRSGVTATMRAALEDITTAAERMVDLKPGDVVLDIGANDGTLLNQYALLDQLIRVAVEPAKNLMTECMNHCELLISDFWSAKVYEEQIKLHAADIRRINDWRPKVITAIGMFYDLEDPSSFIADIAKVLHPDGVFIAQLMCLKQTLLLGDVGNFAHEHLEFYSLKSLDYLFSTHGLEIFQVEENQVNGGSYRLYIQHKNARGISRACELENSKALEDPKTYQQVYNGMVENRRLCVAFIRQAAYEGKKTWVYGASTKGNVILQWYGLGDALEGGLIHGAADRSPEKWGKYTIGSNVLISSEDDFRKARPNYALVLPYAFLDEFLEREQAWRATGGKFIVPLPDFKVL